MGDALDDWVDYTLGTEQSGDDLILYRRAAVCAYALSCVAHAAAAKTELAPTLGGREQPTTCVVVAESDARMANLSAETSMAKALPRGETGNRMLVQIRRMVAEHVDGAAAEQGARIRCRDTCGDHV